MPIYTVIGLYRDEPEDPGQRTGYRQRYATVVQAANPKDAEREAQIVCLHDNRGEYWDGRDETAMLFIAGVFEGDVKPVDDDPTLG